MVVDYKPLERDIARTHELMGEMDRARSSLLEHIAAMHSRAQAILKRYLAATQLGNSVTLPKNLTRLLYDTWATATRAHLCLYGNQSILAFGETVGAWLDGSGWIADLKKSQLSALLFSPYSADNLHIVVTRT